MIDESVLNDQSVYPSEETLNKLFTLGRVAPPTSSVYVLAAGTRISRPLAHLGTRIIQTGRRQAWARPTGKKNRPSARRGLGVLYIGDGHESFKQKTLLALATASPVWRCVSAQACWRVEDLQTGRITSPNTIRQLREKRTASR